MVIGHASNCSNMNGFQLSEDRSFCHHEKT